jgi:hypothetical protein
MVLIGPGGAAVVEVKHWDRATLRRGTEAEPAAELILAKAKRVGGKLRSLDSRLSFVPAVFLFTREAGSLKRNGQQLQHPLGVRAYGLRDVAGLIAGPGVARRRQCRAPRNPPSPPPQPERSEPVETLGAL